MKVISNERKRKKPVVLEDSIENEDEWISFLSKWKKVSTEEAMK